MNREPFASAPPSAKWMVALILLVSAGLRFYGLGWGLPFRMHCDEFNMFNITQNLLTNLAQRGSLSPQSENTGQPVWSAYGALPFYMMAACWVPFKLMRRAGWISLDQETVASTLLVRSLSVVWDLGTIFILYLIGCAIKGSRMGLWAAAFYGFAPLAVRESHFGTTDSFFNFLSMLYLLIFVRLWQPNPNTQTPKHPNTYFWSGIVLGLILSVKLYGFYLAVVPLAMLLLRRLKPQPPNPKHPNSQTPKLPNTQTPKHPNSQTPKHPNSQTPKHPNHWSLVIGHWSLAIVVFALLNPYSWLDPKNYWSPHDHSSVVYQMLVGMGRYHPPPWWSLQFKGTTPYLYYFTHLLPYAIGLPLTILSVAAFAFCLWRITRLPVDPLTPLLLAALVYFLGMGKGEIKMVRYALPLLAPLALFSAFLLTDARYQITDNRWHLASGIWHLTSFLFGGAALAYALIFSVAYLAIYSEPDSRLQAAEWVRKNVPKNATLMLNERDEGSWYVVGSWQERLDFYRLPHYRLVIFDPYERFLEKFGQPLTKEDIAFMRQRLDECLEQADFIWLSGITWDRLKHLPKQFPVSYEFYRKLLNGQTQFRLVKSFVPRPRLGPFEFDDSKAEVTWRLYDHPPIYLFARKRR